ncbi:MAG: prepilin-type N-terminal cleavage/methylation domain-containing protein [Candidatus Gracilibacteria bacterium]|nr:prepilin-type N-terminal cleavage/methylation domain-containing protein [Candidatus Gracilibacteria bacterium]MDQ7022764.1 prepilin-type N-terminal cleavage/methylation domain-containing protein [Candidatus Gracilibacteria bacterium]
MNKKGFTLIEIMIVIVIISLLAVTLVPKLTGAQARARDASRTASLVAMKAVLTAYFDDYSEYPLNPHSIGAGNGCLSSDFKGTLKSGSALEDYVEGGNTSFDPQKNALASMCATVGSFGYSSLSKNGSDKSAFVLVAQTETYQKSNTVFVADLAAKDGTIDIAVAVSSAYLNNNQDIPALKIADDNDALSTVYIVTGS